MKKGIILSIVALALVVGGCKKESAKEGKSDKDTANAPKADQPSAKGLIDFTSTTTITPPGIVNPADPTVVRLLDHPVLVFFQGIGQISYSPPLGFSASDLGKIGSWNVTKFTRDAGNENPVPIQIHVNYDAQAHSYYNPPETQIPQTETKNLYMAFYHGYTNTDTGRQNANATASIIVGDAAIFAPDPAGIASMLKELDKKPKKKKELKKN